MNPISPARTEVCAYCGAPLPASEAPSVALPPDPRAGHDLSASSTLQRFSPSTLQRSHAPTLQRSHAPTLQRAHAPTLQRAASSTPWTAALPRGVPGAEAKRRRYCCYGCRILGEAGQKPLADDSAAHTPWFKIGVGATIAGQAMLLGLAVNLAEPTGPARWLLHWVLLASAAAVMALLGGPLVASATEALRARQISIDFLFLAGIAGAFLASLQSTLLGRGAIYYEIVAVLLTVYSVGRTLGAQSRARALAEAKQLRDVFETCRVLRADGTTARLKAAEVGVGDRVQVFAGEGIPVDGRITQGAAFVRETPLTGEPFPIVRRTGDRVLAGSFSEDGELVVEATVAGANRRLDGLLAEVETARSKGSSLQAQADRVVRWFLPLVLVAAVGAFGYWTGRRDWTTGLFNAMAVLLVACPCAMGLATPIAIWNGLAVLASRGLIAGGGDLLAKLARVTHVVFDKTGTLSEDRASLVDLATVGDVRQRQELTAILQAVQARSQHPVAQAFLSEPADARAPVEVMSIKTIPARGIEAWVVAPQGRELHLRIGQRELMSNLVGEENLLDHLRQASGDNLVYIETDGQLVAIAALREQMRDSVQQTLAALDTLGLTYSVLTGDRPERASQLPLANALGGLTPADKVAQIEAMRARGERVAFVGDGVNDAPAMGAADAGVALAHGAGLTTANADAVLYGGDLRNVPWAIALCRQVRDSIHSNLVFAAAYNLIGITLAAAGLLHPVVAALLMVLSSAIVSWRALRATHPAELCCGPSGERVGLATSTRGSAKVERTPCLPIQTPSDRPNDGASAAWHGRPARGLGQDAQATSRRSAFAYGVLLALQGPFIAWLGQLSTLGSGAVIVGCGLAGLGLARFRTQSPELLRYADMTFGMLAAGNWGMLLGWWADAGFNPLSTPAACPSCHLQGLFASGAFKVPWMYVGMLALGLPPMMRDLTGQVSLRLRLTLTGLSGLGMVLGMAWGSAITMRVLDGHAFLPMLGGMVLGMLVGMFFFCELGRAVAQRFGFR